MTCLLCTFLEEKIGILQLRLVASMRTYMEQKVQPFAFGCSFEPHEYFWIIFCLEKSNPPRAAFFLSAKPWLCPSLGQPWQNSPRVCSCRQSWKWHSSFIPASWASPTSHRDQNHPFSPGIWGRKWREHWILLQDKIPSIQVSHVVLWVFRSSGKGAPAQPQDKTHRTKTILEVPGSIWMAERLGNTQEFNGAKQNVSPISLSTTTCTLSPTKSMRGTALPWFSG